jgi:tetratricopeptide (TPR) repeat protein
MNEQELGDQIRAALRLRPSSGNGGCPDQAQWLAFHAGHTAEAESEAMRAHLIDCALCRELAADAARFLAATADLLAAPAARGRIAIEKGPARRWMVVALAAAAAAGMAFLVLRPPARPPVDQAVAPEPAVHHDPWRDLEIPKAEYSVDAAPEDLIWRGEQDHDATPASPFDRGMEAYLGGDYTRAELELGAALRERPDDGEAAFYRGVTLLLLDRPHEALDPLQRAVRRRVGSEHDQALLYLGLALLKTGHQQQAREVLERVSPAGEPASARARALLARIEDQRQAAAGP